MKIYVKSRAFKDRLKGHKDAILALYSPCIIDVCLNFRRN